MNIPVLNNHLKRQYVLLGKKEDLEQIVDGLRSQGETPRYCCCVDCKDDKYLTIEQCISLCLSDVSIVVWTVSEDCVEWISKFQSNGIEIMAYNDMFSDVENRACHFEEMYIDRYGTVHCCCKTYLGNTIGNLSDPKISEKIVNYSPTKECVCSKGKLSSKTELPEKMEPELASIELSSLCNAQCTYCFQNDEHKGSRYLYYDELLKMIFDLQLKKLIFAGGEILVQPDSIRFLRTLRNANPNIWMHLKSNGCHSIDLINIVNELFDSITITLNGFGTSTVTTIMNVPFSRTKLFCEKICEYETIKVGIKLLASPANVCEIPEFLEWCISLNPDRIIIPSARVYSCREDAPNEWLGSSFNGLNRAYWNPLFRRIGDRIKRILKMNIKSSVLVQVDNELQNLLDIADIIKEFNYGG